MVRCITSASVVIASRFNSVRHSLPSHRRATNLRWLCSWMVTLTKTPTRSILIGLTLAGSELWTGDVKRTLNEVHSVDKYIILIVMGVVIQLQSYIHYILFRILRILLRENSKG